MNDKKQAPELSPQMQMCAAELKEVLARYDVAAVVLLHEPAQVTYFVKLDPSYSLATMHDQKLKLSAAKPNLENPDAIPEGALQTVNMFNNLCGMLNTALNTMAQSLRGAQVFYNLRPKQGFGAIPTHNGKQQPGKS